MKQPKSVRILECSEKTRCRLTDEVYECVIQTREPDDTSEIVYIKNPWYQPGPDSERKELLPRTKEEVFLNTEYLAFTKGEYEVVKMTRK